MRTQEFGEKKRKKNEGTMDDEENRRKLRNKQKPVRFEGKK